MTPYEKLSELATRSILLEVSCHPKPGLVTPQSTGSHKDMDYYLFLKSTAVLSQGFRTVSEFGYCFDGGLPEMLGPVREKGIAIEKRMFEVTEGVNTQKGLIFLFCMLLGGAGQLSRNGGVTHLDICRSASAITSGIVKRELAPLLSREREELSKGERVFVDHGMTGIRGEVENGLPSVIGTGLPLFSNTLEETGDVNLSALQALLGLMTVVEDTNIVSRAGIGAYNEVREMAKRVLEDGGATTQKGMDGVSEMEYYFMKRNISPGGSADLLSATMFLYFVRNELI